MSLDSQSKHATSLTDSGSHSISISSFIPHLPLLESFSLVGGDSTLVQMRDRFSPFSALFDQHKRLKSLVIRACIPGVVLNAIINQLPASLTRLVLSRDVCSPDPDPQGRTRLVQAMASQLTEFGCFEIPLELDWSGFLQLRRLRLAVESIPKSLAALPALAELIIEPPPIVHDWLPLHGYCYGPIAMHLPGLIDESSTMQVVQVPWDVQTLLLREYLTEIQAAAARRSAKLVFF